MRISASAMNFKSFHSVSQSNTVIEKSRLWVKNTASTHMQPVRGMQKIQLSNASKRATVDSTPVSTHCPKTGRSNEVRNQDPRMAILCDIIETLTGKPIRIFSADAMQQTAPAENTLAFATSSGSISVPTPSPTSSNAGFGYEYQRHQIYTEKEVSAFSANGTIKTDDGQTINFSLSINMSRNYLEESDTQIKLGDAVKATDPLVINFSGAAAQLTDRRFSFDLNADGQQQSLAQLTSGSGFLALDRNHDGKINDGSELFGPSTGDGYIELAAFDDDTNGWIDENDAVFNSLSIWQSELESFNKNKAQIEDLDMLKSLADTGVGAIALRTVQTPFSIKNSHNDLLGQVRSSSVFLTETGRVGSTQQVDLVA